MTDSQRSLSLLVFQDLWRHKGLFSMALINLCCAFAVILTVHHARQGNIVLEQLLERQDQLKVEYRHLLLEENSLAEHSRIERLASSRLKMIRPSPESEKVVRLP
ncbi:cell division protein FtsL [Corallincola luteus]|uniref:Cell division protein FtsL n=1 Tax=Corallincola luteus TaxID=1775177 RepID=A0ABY2ALI1_9GAMM|nr:cell division protein FtsL [Corallincola luteus]TCI03581.1 cell division protein FtsL [Corallincola luteus]